MIFVKQSCRTAGPHLVGGLRCLAREERRLRGARVRVDAASAVLALNGGEPKEVTTTQGTMVTTTQGTTVTTTQGTTVTTWGSTAGTRGSGVRKCATQLYCTWSGRKSSAHKKCQNKTWREGLTSMKSRVMTTLAGPHAVKRRRKGGRGGRGRGDLHDLDDHECGLELAQAVLVQVLRRFWSNCDRLLFRARLGTQRSARQPRTRASPGQFAGAGGALSGIWMLRRKTFSEFISLGGCRAPLRIDQKRFWSIRPAAQGSLVQGRRGTRAC